MCSVLKSPCPSWAKSRRKPQSPNGWCWRPASSPDAAVVSRPGDVVWKQLLLQLVDVLAVGPVKAQGCVVRTARSSKYVPFNPLQAALETQTPELGIPEALASSS